MARVNSAYMADDPEILELMIGRCSYVPERFLPIFTSRCIVCGSGDLSLSIDYQVLCNSRDRHPRS